MPIAGIMVSKLGAGMAMRCRISCKAGMGDTIAYLRVPACVVNVSCHLLFVPMVLKAAAFGFSSNIKKFGLIFVVFVSAIVWDGDACILFAACRASFPRVRSAASWKSLEPALDNSGLK